MPLVVDVTIYPNGDERRSRRLDKIVIVNDGTGTVRTGSYKVVAAWGSTTIRGFDRRKGATALAARALATLVREKKISGRETD